MTFFVRRNPGDYLYAFVFITMVISLHACGFQLRGTINISDDISPIYIEQNSVFDLAREIKSLLVTNNIKIVDNAEQSKAQLTLLSEEKTRRVLSVDGNGQAREYLIIYKVTFAINTKQTETSGTEKTATKNNEGSVSQDSISLSRTWLFDPAAVLAVTNEAEVIYEEMQRDAARLILLKLQARSKNDAIKNDNAAAVQTESINNQ